jgi:hypothetical protein
MAIVVRFARLEPPGGEPNPGTHVARVLEDGSDIGGSDDGADAGAVMSRRQFASSRTLRSRSHRRIATLIYVACKKNIDLDRHLWIPQPSVVASLEGGVAQRR